MSNEIRARKLWPQSSPRAPWERALSILRTTPAPRRRCTSRPHRPRIRTLPLRWHRSLTLFFYARRQLSWFCFVWNWNEHKKELLIFRIKNETFWQQRRMVLHMGVSCTSKVGLRFGTIGVDLRFFRFGSASIKRVRTAQICPSVLPLPQYAQVPVVYFRLRSTIVATFLDTYV